MSKPPTSHYSRPFYLALEKLNIRKNNCINGIPWIKFLLDFCHNYMDIYKKYGFFGFQYINKYSHDSNDPLPWNDEDLYKFLKNFKENEELSSNTILSNNFESNSFLFEI